MASNAASHDQTLDHTRALIDHNSLDQANAAHVADVAASANASANRAANNSTASLSDTAQSAAANQASSASAAQNVAQKTAKTEALHTSSTNLAFTNLENLNSKHMVVQVQMNSSSSQSQLSVFQGLNQKVLSSSQFSEAFPVCR